MKQNLEFTERFWKILANVWTLLSMAFFAVDFLNYGKYDSIAGAVGVSYIAILGLYAGTKEYDRWQGNHFSRYMGEYFVVFWTVLLVGFLAAIIISQNSYRLPSEIITIYISVLGIFAITQKSKSWHKKERQPGK